MGKITTVDGLEMFAFQRPPGSAQCDNCGLEVQVQCRARDTGPALKDLKDQGWEIGLGKIGDPALCPECNK
jgi:hypothetical protein